MIPERPILHPRCHTVRSGGTLAFRRGTRLLYLDDPRRLAFAERLVTALDGRSLGELIEAMARRPEERLEALVVLHELGREGFIVPRDLGTSEMHAASPPRAAARKTVWQGRRLHLVVAGSAAEELARALRHVGAVVEKAREDDEPADLTALCLDAPDLDTIEWWNRRAVRAGQPFVAAFPLGDELVFGPLVVAGGACARCLLLRLAGIAPHVPVERALLESLTGGRGRGEPVDATGARALAFGLVRYLDRLVEVPRAAAEVDLADRSSGETTTHRLHAHPACDVCGDGDGRGSFVAALGWADRRAVTAHPPQPGDGEARLAAVVDDRIGLVSTPIPLADADGGGDLHIATARFAVFHPELVVSSQRSLVCGMAPTTGEATLVARIEAIERYCLGATVTPAATASYTALAGDAVDPSTLPLYSERQAGLPGFPFARFDPEQPLTWIWAYDLMAGRPRLLPEECASGRLSRPRLFAATSSGVAAHWSLEAALVAAALELVERDAFLVHWLLRRSPSRLTEAAAEAAFPAACRELRDDGYRLVVADLSVDLPLPVAAAFGIGDDDGKPALLLGAAAALDGAAAAEKAVRELRGAVRSWRDRRIVRGEPLAPHEVRRLDDHAAAYAHLLWRERASFLWAGPEVDSLGGAPAPVGERPLSRLLTALGGHRRALLAIDLTTPDVEPSGLRVVRAVVPGLLPLGFGPFANRLGGTRPFDVATLFGLSVGEAELSSDPHCFP